MGSCWFLEFHKTTAPRVEAYFTKKVAQNNDIIRTLNVCKVQQVVLLEMLGEVGSARNQDINQPRGKIRRKKRTLTL
jgi:hypothetical protein